MSAAMRILFLLALLLGAGAHAAQNAAFVSQSVPSGMLPGQSYTVSITVQNTGTSTWAAGTHRLGSQNPQFNTIWSSNGRMLLPAGTTVAPGANGTFSMSVTAPSSPGTYNFQWRMFEELVEWFGALTPNVAVKVGINDAAFVSQNVPPVMTPGQTYPVTVTMNNSGGKTWSQATNHRLGSQNPQDNTLWTGASRVMMPSGSSVAPGANHTFSFNVTAPTTPGTYNFQWKMLEELVEWFGAQSTNLAIKVGLDNAAFVSQSVPSTMLAGQNYAVSVTMQNTGSTTWAAGTVGLGSQNPQGNTTWGSSKINLASAVPPSAQTTFNFSFTAPSEPGTYNFQWRMVEGSNGWFGAQTVNVPVAVTGTAPDANVFFIHTDHLNTPRLVANTAGTTVWRWEQQEPFGVNAADENPSALGAFEFPLRFTGQHADKETNTVYNGMRDYDPSTGRFTTSDPLGLDHHINPYSYANFNPLLYNDPTGEAATLSWCLGGPLPCAAGVATLGVIWAMSQNSSNSAAKSPACDICGLAGPGGSPNPPDPCQLDPAHPNCPKNAALGVSNPTYPKAQVPKLPGGMTNAQFGKLVGWGSGPRGAAQCRAALTQSDIARLRAAGITRDDIQAWQNFYQNVFTRNANNLTAQQRALLMQQILQRW